MPTFDCFRDDTGLLSVVTGAAAPPVVTNEDTGATTMLVPARIDHGVCSSSVSNPPSPAMATAGCWSTPLTSLLPADSEARVQLRLEVDGQTYRSVLRRTWR